MSWVADRKLWVTADGERVVEDGDPDARILLCVPGQTVPDDVATRYGLGKAAKGRKKPARDKAVKPARDKGGGG